MDPETDSVEIDQGQNYTRVQRSDVPVKDIWKVIWKRSMSGCVYSTIVCRIFFIPGTLLELCVLLLFAVHTYRLSLCYFLGLGHILLTRVGDSFKLQNVNDVLLLIDCGVNYVNLRPESVKTT
jgi:hypothetical protein